MLEAATGKTVAILKADGDSIRDLAVSPDERWIATTCDKNAHLWRFPKTGRFFVLLRWIVHVTRVRLQDLPKYLKKKILRRDDGPFGSWSWSSIRNPECSTPVAILSHSKSVWDVAFHPTMRQLATGATDWKIHVWDVFQGRELEVLEADPRPTSRLAFSPDGRRIVSRSVEKSTLVWARSERWRLSEESPGPGDE